MLFQCAALTFGLGTLLLCANLFGLLQRNPAIPGAACGDGARRLVLAERSGALRQRFTYAQAEALAKAAPGLVARYAGLSFDVQRGQEPARRAGVVAVDPDMFQRMCIAPATGRWPSGTGHQATVPANGAEGATIRIGAGRYEVAGTNRAFRGIYGDAGHSIYIPIGSLAHAGLDTGRIDLPSVTVLVFPPPQGADRVLRSLDETAGRNPSLFGVGSRLQAQAILPIAAADAERLDAFARIVAIVGGAFVVLGLLTIVAYQFGRLGTLAANLALIRELGAPPSACLKYSLVEPAGIFAAAILAAIPIEFLLRRWLVGWLGLPATISPGAIVYAGSLLAIVLVAAACSLLVAMAILHFARSNISRRTRRVVQKTFQYAAGLQAAACLLAILPAIASLLAYSQAVPSTRGYDIDDVRVHPIFLAKDMLPPDFSNRAPSLLREIDARVGGTSAIATTAFPLPGQGSWSSSVDFQGKTYNLELDPVTASYFEVLRLRPIRGRLFSAEDQPASDADGPSVAVANRAAAEMLGIRSLPSGPVIIGKATSAYRATVSIVGVVDEKTSGTEAAGSVDRLRPAIYTPWRAGGPFLLAVRHPHRMPAERVDAMTTQALDRYLPEWRKAELPDTPTSLEALYRKATSAQRTVFYLFGALAFGAALLAFAGLLGSALMALGLNLKSYAIKYSLGATRGRIAREHHLATGAPILVALGGATVLGVVASKPIADFMDLAFPEVLGALAAALSLVLVAGAAGLGLSARALGKADVGRALRDD